jgi:hypothetical protein
MKKISKIEYILYMTIFKIKTKFFKKNKRKPKRYIY